MATETIKHIEAIPTIEPGRTETAYRFKMIIQVTLSDGGVTETETHTKLFESAMPVEGESAEVSAHSRARDHMWRVARHAAEAKIREIFAAGAASGEWGGLTALESMEPVTKISPPPLCV